MTMQTNRIQSLARPLSSALCVLCALFFSLTEARAQTQYTYDPQGRLASVTYPDGSRIVYTRDANGNLIGQQRTGPTSLADASVAADAVSDANAAVDATTPADAAAGNDAAAQVDAAGRPDAATAPDRRPAADSGSTSSVDDDDDDDNGKAKDGCGCATTHDGWLATAALLLPLVGFLMRRRQV